jgi:hypothetical protein
LAGTYQIESISNTLLIISKFYLCNPAHRKRLSILLISFIISAGYKFL